MREWVLAANLSNQQCRGVVSLKLDINTLLEVSNLLVSPHVADFIFLAFVKTRDLAKVSGLGNGSVERVHHEDVDSALGAAGVVFGGVGLVPCPGWIDPPFVRERGCTPGIVLVESKELPVLQDSKISIVDSV